MSRYVPLQVKRYCLGLAAWTTEGGHARRVPADAAWLLGHSWVTFYVFKGT